MIKQAMTRVAIAALVAAPTVVGAQATTTPPPAEQGATCDCPIGDARGSLRDLTAFAPLGLLGALAAAGGAPAFVKKDVPTTGTPVVATIDPNPTRPTENETSTTESGRTGGSDPVRPAPSVRPDIPEHVSPDSLRGGVRAPNTGTPLPSVFLIGSGLVAIGCVTLIRTRG